MRTAVIPIAVLASLCAAGCSPAGAQQPPRADFILVDKSDRVH